MVEYLLGQVVVVAGGLIFWYVRGAILRVLVGFLIWIHPGLHQVFKDTIILPAGVSSIDKFSYLLHVVFSTRGSRHH